MLYLCCIFPFGVFFVFLLLVCTFILCAFAYVFYIYMVSCYISPKNITCQNDKNKNLTNIYSSVSVFYSSFSFFYRVSLRFLRFIEIARNVHDVRKNIFWFLYVVGCHEKDITISCLNCNVSF